MPTAARASSTDADFQALLKQAQPDMPLATATPVAGDLPAPAPTTHADPPPATDPGRRPPLPSPHSRCSLRPPRWRSNWWVPDGYRYNHDTSLDYGLVAIAPLNGRYIGNVTGSYSITPSLKWSTGKRTRLMGYPASGFWATSAGYFGNAQYACDVNWNEGYSTSDSGYDLWATCPMNGGASGGPWFALDNNNQWTIAGVNSRCYDATGNKCVPPAQYMITSYIDSRFFTFWNSVNSQLRY